MNMLEKIFKERSADVEEAKKSVSLSALKESAESRIHHSLVQKLSDRPGEIIIAEMKKASPSAGLLREDYDPAAIAGIYEEAGAAGISVLTEPRHFLGADGHLREVRRVTDLPLLRKDFICDPYQVYETAALGADVILLILAGLEEKIVRSLYETAVNLGLDVLAETHNVKEVELAVSLEKAIIGVNSRDLKTLKTDLVVAESVAKYIPGDRCAVAESGIRMPEDLLRLKALGYKGFLIGEAIIGQSSPAQALRRFIC